MKSGQNLKTFWRSSQNDFVLALFCSLHRWQPFSTYPAVEKLKIIVKYCQFNLITIVIDAVKLMANLYSNICKTYTELQTSFFSPHIQGCPPSE
jgi:hypothetical protein